MFYTIYYLLNILTIAYQYFILLNFNKNLFDKFQYKKYQHQGIDKALKCPYLCIVFDRDQYNEHIFETNNRTHENNYFFYF